MSTRLSTVGLVIAVSLMGSGCAHVQLKKNTVNQAQTVTEIYQQQVLNNLAMFVFDANSLPHFAYADEGASSVNDAAGGNVMEFNAPGPFIFGADVSRGIQESWTLKPVSDPHKLTLMRCAYQHAVQDATLVPAVNTTCKKKCPDCNERFERFYSGHDHDEEFGEKDKVKQLLCLDKCWFGFGTKADVPKRCHCSYVGHYCGVYVWVETGQGRDQLAQLTMMILDYAVNDPGTEKTKKVVVKFKVKLDAKGKPVEKDGKVVYVETGKEETYDEAIEKEVKDDQGNTVLDNGKPKMEKQYYPRARTPQPGFSPLRFEQRQRALAR